MTPKVLEKYRVNTQNFPKVPHQKGSFFSNAKKNITRGSGKKENLSANIDKILYGK